MSPASKIRVIGHLRPFSRISSFFSSPHFESTLVKRGAADVEAEDPKDQCGDGSGDGIPPNACRAARTFRTRRWVRFPSGGPC